MSHFTVLIVTDYESDLEDILAPFYEQYGPEDWEARAKGWIEFEDKAEEYKEEYENENVDVVRLSDGALEFRTNDMFLKNKPGLLEQREYEYPEGSELVSVPLSEFYPTFEEFCRDWQGADPEEPLGYWYNPQAKWDWWMVGGRYIHTLRLNKEGAIAYAKRESNAPSKGDPTLLFDQEELDKIHANETEVAVALVKHVDWDGMLQEYVDAVMAEYDYYHEAAKEARRYTSQNDVARAYVVETKTKYKDYKDQPADRLAEWLEQYEQDGYRGEKTREIFATFRSYIDNELAEQILRIRHDAWLFGQTWDDVQNRLLPRDEFKASKSLKAQTFAFIDLNGNWVERGNMGWWAMVTDRNENYDAAWWEFVRSLDDEQRVFVVDCHI